MKGFEADKWIKKRIENRIYIFNHKDFEFIKIRAEKIRTGYRNNGILYNEPVWNFLFRSWNLGKNFHVKQSLHIKKMNEKYAEKFFNDMINDDKTKSIIFNYLFEGNWKA